MSNLAFDALVSRIIDAAKIQGVKSYRIAWKRNARGEMVLALIIADRDGTFGPDALGE